MILITIPFWQDNCAATEQLLEFIFSQNDRVQINGHILLAYPPTVAPDMVARIKISAELAFVGVHTLELRPLTDPVAPKWKACNNAFSQAATHIFKSFRWPFLWCEPDTVPTAKSWLPRLVTAYGQQPKSYMGPQLKITTAGKPDAFIMARCAVYPPHAIQDVPMVEMPYEIANSGNVLPRLTTSKLIQHTSILNEEDLGKVRPDAILVHGDKHGFLRRKLEAGLKPVESVIQIPVEPMIQPQREIVPVNGALPKKRGRPSKAEMAARALAAEAMLNGH